jgi:hypothetical protein
MISIQGLDKGALIAALYNNAKIQGLGVHNPAGSSSMTAEQAASLRRLSFDYLNGRTLKIDVSGDEFEEWLYDRDNGQDKAARVIENLRRTGSVEEII